MDFFDVLRDGAGLVARKKSVRIAAAKRFGFAPAKA
jgi:hypothetical protein